MFSPSPVTLSDVTLDLQDGGLTARSPLPAPAPLTDAFSGLRLGSHPPAPQHAAVPGPVAASPAAEAEVARVVELLDLPEDMLRQIVDTLPSWRCAPVPSLLPPASSSLLLSSPASPRGGV